MRLGILGPLLVINDSGLDTRVNSARQRTLLAALLVRANRIVSLDELIDIVWDGAPVDGAARTLRSYAMRLRRAVGPAVAARILTRDPGYLCQAGEDELDVLHFEALCGTASAAMRERCWPRASDAAGQALELWRGSPLVDVPSQALRQEFLPRMEQLRLQVLEDRIEAELRMARHDRLVPELRDLVAAHPLRERFQAQLMLALAAGGRRAEALATYRQAREVLVAELGIEPGAELRDLHERILAADVTPASLASQPPERTSSPAPRQLPPAAGCFTGRAEEIAALSGLADRCGRQAGTVVVAAICGAAGVGKTALALHWAHGHADRFADGQFFMNLRGFDPAAPPVEPSVVARRLLDAFGVPAVRIPADRDAQLDLYRSTLAGKRVLIVLDNARDAEQVRPLLPGESGCLVLVTSRDQMAGLIALDDAVPLRLGPLSHEEARDYLVNRLGARHVGDGRAAGELVELCARLPLALTIATARAILRPEVSLPSLVDQLRDTRQRLSVLTVGDGAADVRMVLSWSYHALDPDTARLFRLLGAHPGPAFTARSAACLAGISLDQARTGLNRLTRAHLLIEQLPGRHAFHDLLRIYANEQAQHYDSDIDRLDAVHRVLDHYMYSARSARQNLFPALGDLELPPAPLAAAWEEFTGRESALDWYQAELPALISAVNVAADAGFDYQAWRIAWAIGPYLEHGGHWREWTATCRIALAAAVRNNDLKAVAATHRWLGRIDTVLGHYEHAQAHLSAALTLFTKLGEQRSLGHTHIALGRALAGDHRLTEAITQEQRALELFRQAGDLQGQERTLNDIGWCHALLGEHEQTLTYCREALGLAREISDTHGEAAISDSLGHAYHHLGQFTEATTCYHRAISLRQADGDRYYQAGSLTRLGDTYRSAGVHPAARHAWQQALALLNQLDHPDAHSVRAKLDL